MLAGLVAFAGGCDSASRSASTTVAGSVAESMDAAAGSGGSGSGAGAGAGAGSPAGHAAIAGMRAVEGGSSAGAAGARSAPAGEGASAAGSAGATGAAGAAGASTAGSGSAGDGAAGSDAATSGAPLSFADSFEGASLEEAGYELASTNCSGDGTAQLEPSGAHSGQSALRIQASGGYCNHVFVRPKQLTGALPAPLYGRVFVKLMTPLAAGHTTFLAMHDQAEDKDLRLGGQNDVLVWNRESDDATLPELSPTGVMLSAAIPAGDWHCLEWFVDSAAREIKTWLDDRELPGLTLDAEPTPDVDTQWQRKADWQPQLNDLRLGWESYGEQANTLWFDDLAVHSSRVGCESP